MHQRSKPSVDTRGLKGCCPARSRRLKRCERMESPSFEALLSKLGTIFQMANSPPRITARRGGRAIKKISRSIRFSRGRGGVPIDGTRNTTPAASIRRFRLIFLVTPPTLLAVMRGGEFALFQMRPPPHIAVSAALAAALNDFCNPNVDRYASTEGKNT